MNYQWYPGHMTKAIRMMQENIKLIDLVIEVVDARIPLSSRNPDIDTLAANKSRIILLNKSDLADPRVNKQWISYYEKKGFYALEINAKGGAGIKAIQPMIQLACKEKIERDKRRGIVNRPVRAMVVGIPNVGKSTFINAYAGKACAKTGNKPGVTKGKQWINLGKNLQLLDTPGILWPKFEDNLVGMHLAFIGSMNDEIIIMEELACDLIKSLLEIAPKGVEERYGCELDQDPLKALEQIAESRKCYQKGEQLDLSKASLLLLDDYRSGKLGRISLETPPEAY